MKLTCPNRICKYTWDYKGTSEFYATCPRCRAKVNTKTQQTTKPSTITYKED